MGGMSKQTRDEVSDATRHLRLNYTQISEVLKLEHISVKYFLQHVHGLRIVGINNLHIEKLKDFFFQIVNEPVNFVFNFLMLRAHTLFNL